MLHLEKSRAISMRERIVRISHERCTSGQIRTRKSDRLARNAEKEKEIDQPEKLTMYLREIHPAIGDRQSAESTSTPGEIDLFVGRHRANGTGEADGFAGLANNQHLVASRYLRRGGASLRCVNRQIAHVSPRARALARARVAFQANAFSRPFPRHAGQHSVRPDIESRAFSRHFGRFAKEALTSKRNAFV